MKEEFQETVAKGKRLWRTFLAACCWGRRIVQITQETKVKHTAGLNQIRVLPCSKVAAERGSAMQLAPSLVLLVLVGCGLPGSPACTLDEATSRCTCSFTALEDIFSFTVCFRAMVFEFRDGHFEKPNDIDSLNLDAVVPFLQLPIDKVILGNSVFHEYFVLMFLKLTRNVSIRELVFEDCTFTGRADWQSMEGNLPQIRYLQFSNVSSPPLTDRERDFSHISSWMARMKSIVLTRSQITHIPHSISMQFNDLHVLDLSENRLQDQGVNDSFSDRLFPHLKTVKLRRNGLTSFDVACKALSKLPNLQDLDLSQNNFSKPLSPSCEWPKSMRLLNLSDSGLEHISTQLLPPSIEVLDLSYNKLSSLRATLPHLKEVYLQRNRLHSLPSSSDLPDLEVLILDGNRMTQLPKDQLQSFKHLSLLRADGNPYICSCSIVNEMKELLKSSFVVQQWPEGYLCDSPSAYKGYQIGEVETSVFECHKAPIIAIICVVILLVVASVVAAVCWVRTRLARV